jgi:hypothetical protein
MTPIPSPTLVDLLRVCNDLRDDELAQIAALDFADVYDPERQAAALFAKDGPAFVLRDADGIAYCAGGLEPVGPGIMRLWMRCTDAGWLHCGLSVTRTAKQIIHAVLGGDVIHRVQVMVLASRTDACAWYERSLGLIKEAQHAGYGRNGEDVFVYRLNRSDLGENHASD